MHTRDVTAEAFDAVLFDMDGTLVSSIASVERSWARLVVEQGAPRERLIPFGYHGVPGRDIIAELFADRSEQERAELLAWVSALELADATSIEVLAGAQDALAVLAPAGRCAVVTSSGRALAAARLTAVDLPAVSTVVSADDVTAGKPDPEPYLAGARILGVRPERCLVVEDTDAGVRSGRDAGAAVIGLRTTEPDGPAGDPDLVVADLAAVRWTVGPDGVRVALR